MPRLKHDRDGWTYACPVCDGTTIYERSVDGGHGIQDPDKPYRCESADCGATFLYVIERPVKGRSPHAGQSTLPGTERKQLSRELAALQPEDAGLSPVGVRGGAD